MTKRKFKMKLSSRRNGTLVPDDDSDSDLQEFSLPKKRIIKPGKSTYVARLGSSTACLSQRKKRLALGEYMLYFHLVHSIFIFRTFQTEMRLLSSLCFGFPFRSPHSFRLVCSRVGMVQLETQA